MKIKKEFVEDIYLRIKYFEIRNSQDKEGFYWVRPKVGFECEPRLFYLESVDYVYIRFNNTDEVIWNEIDDMFKRYNGQSAKESLDTKTYEWIENNMDYFRKTGWCELYRWILLPSYTTPQELEVVE